MANDYDVHLIGQPEPIRVSVKYPDMVVAEREAPKYGVPSDPSAAPMAITTVWVWCALRRMGGLSVGHYPEFMAALDDLIPVKAAQEGSAQLADPTQPPEPTPSP